MNFGEDLTLGMLSEDKDDILQDDFLLETKDEAFTRDLDGALGENPSDNVDINKIISEENKSPESVAEKDKKTPEKATPSPGSDPKQSLIYSSLASHLHETGVLPSLNLTENKINSTEDLQKAIKAEIDNSIEENIKNYNAAMQRGEPQSDYAAYSRQKNYLDSITDTVLSGADDQSANVRFNLIGQDFLNRGYSKEEATKFANRSISLGEDEGDARAALEKIKEHATNEYNSKVKAKLDEEKGNVDKITKFVRDTDEIIKGLKINQTTKDNLIKQMTTGVGVDKDGKPLTKYGDALSKDPVKMKTITEYLFLLSNGFTDFSKMKNIIESKAVSEFDNILRNNGGFLNEGSPNFNNNDSQSTFSLGDFEID